MASLSSQTIIQPFLLPGVIKKKKKKTKAETSSLGGERIRLRYCPQLYWASGEKPGNAASPPARLTPVFLGPQGTGTVGRAVPEG